MYYTKRVQFFAKIMHGYASIIIYGSLHIFRNEFLFWAQPFHYKIPLTIRAYIHVIHTLLHTERVERLFIDMLMMLRYACF